jgi:hypothetical protein
MIAGNEPARIDKSRRERELSIFSAPKGRRGTAVVISQAVIRGENRMTLASLFNLTMDQVERRKKMLILTFLVFAALC